MTGSDAYEGRVHTVRRGVSYVMMPWRPPSLPLQLEWYGSQLTEADGCRKL